MMTLTAGLLLGAQAAQSETQSYGSFRHDDGLPEALFLVGEIKEGDSFELRRAMRDHTIALVVAGSGGGNLYEGLQMASILHDRGIGTYVPEGIRCESSCANIFFGGTHRLVQGELGVHQFYLGGDAGAGQTTRSVATATTQYTTAEIIGIMNEFSTPPFVYEKMFGTGDIYYFTAEQKPKLALGTEDMAFAELVSRADAFMLATPEAARRPQPPAPPGAFAQAALQPPALPAVPAPVPAGSGERYENIDFFGSDLSPRGVRDVSLSDCESICRNDPACAAYSYVVETRWCWPKSRVENVSAAPGTVSGISDYARVNMEALNRPYFEITGTDLSGFDIYPKGLRNLSLAACRAACDVESTCKAFSWVAKKAWCFPKYDVGPMREALGTISGVRK